MPAVFSTADALILQQGEPAPRGGADRGAPLARYADLFSGHGTEVGVWSCTEGGWPIVARPDTEVVLILTGKAVITDDDGTATNVGPGDLFVLPKGWSGRWDIIEPVEKLFVTVKEPTS